MNILPQSRVKISLNHGIIQTVIDTTIGAGSFDFGYIEVSLARQQEKCPNTALASFEDLKSKYTPNLSL